MAEIIDIFDKKINDNEFEKAIIKYNETKNDSDYENAKLYYYKKRVEYEIMIQREEDYEWKQNWGMGFWFVLNEYKGNSVISDFIAKCMLNEIYEENDDFNLESYLHSKFKSKDSLLKIGIKQYIINSLMSYDECLSGYLQVHINLISEIENRINDIVSNWDNYKSKEINENSRKTKYPDNNLELYDNSRLLLNDTMYYISSPLSSPDVVFRDFSFASTPAAASPSALAPSVSPASLVPAKLERSTLGLIPRLSPIPSITCLSDVVTSSVIMAALPEPYMVILSTLARGVAIAWATNGYI